MFQLTLPFVLCISLLTYQQQMYISLLPPDNQEEQPFFSISRNSEGNFSLVTVWTLSGKDPSVSKSGEDRVVHKMEFSIKVTEGAQDYYLATKPKNGRAMTVVLTTNEQGAARFTPNPSAMGFTGGDDLLDVSKPFFIRYEHNRCSYLLHILKNPNGGAVLFLQKLRYPPPRGSELVYAMKEE